MPKEKIALDDLAPCGRCKRPLLREGLPSVTLVRRLVADARSLDQAIPFYYKQQIDLVTGRKITHPSLDGVQWKQVPR